MEIHDDAFRVTTVAGLVILDGPYGMALTLTPGAAIRSCKLIMDSAAIAATYTAGPETHVNRPDLRTDRSAAGSRDLGGAIARLAAFRLSLSAGDEIDERSHLTADDLDTIIDAVAADAVIDTLGSVA
jgi:hypothetical protein